MWHEDMPTLLIFKCFFILLSYLRKFKLYYLSHNIKANEEHELAMWNAIHFPLQNYIRQLYYDPKRYIFLITF